MASRTCCGAGSWWRRWPAARGDTGNMSLWAGQGYRLAAELPAAEIIERLRG
jgi:NAD(P)H-dependent flavin oxidoreductase YrpB (nitropropane dioxygenase family)